MRRLFAIVILKIFLLNVMGYYAVLLGLKINSAQELAERLNSDMYDLGATVTFQVPLDIPYSSDSESYERVDGEFKKDGEVYRLVKQRLHQGILYIVCVKDHKSSNINNTLEDLVQSFAGQADDNQQSVSAPSLIKDYVDSQIVLTPALGGWELEIGHTSVSREFFDSYSASIVHPPCI